MSYDNPELPANMQCITVCLTLKTAPAPAPTKCAACNFLASHKEATLIHPMQHTCDIRKDWMPAPMMNRHGIEIEPAVKISSNRLNKIPFPECAKNCAAVEMLGCGECECVCPHKFNSDGSSKQAPPVERGYTVEEITKVVQEVIHDYSDILGEYVKVRLEAAMTKRKDG